MVDRASLSLEAADIELQAQLKTAAAKRLHTTRYLLTMDDIPVVTSVTGELWASMWKRFYPPTTS